MGEGVNLKWGLKRVKLDELTGVKFVEVIGRVGINLNVGVI